MRDVVLAIPTVQRDGRSLLTLVAALLALILLGTILIFSQRNNASFIPAIAQPTPTLKPNAITSENADMLEVKRLIGMGKYTGPLAWSAENGLAAASRYDVELLLPVGGVLRSFLGADVTAVAYNPTGDKMAVGYADGSLKLWDVNSAQVITEFAQRDSAVKQVSISPDGSELLAMYERESVLWGIADGQAYITVDEPGAVGSWFVGGKPFMVAYPDRIRIYNTNSGITEYPAAAALLEGIDAPITAAAASDNLATLVLGFADGQVILQTSDGTVSRLQFEALPVSQIIFSADKNQIAILTGAKVNVFTVPLTENSNSVSDKTELEPHNGYAILGAAFSPTGDALATVGMDGFVRVHEIASGAEVASFGGGLDLTALAFTPDGTGLFTGSSIMPGRLWDVETGKPRVRFITDFYWMGVAFSPDGKLLANVWQDGVVLSDPTTGQIVTTLEFMSEYANTVPGDGGDARSAAVAFSPDGKLLAAGRLDGTVWLWDVESRQHLTTLNSQNTLVYGLAFSPDSTKLAVSSGLSLGSDNVIRVWDVTSGQIIHELHGYPEFSEVTRVAFSPDGTKLASVGGGDGALRLWDTATGETIYTKTLTAPVLGVAFSVDGSVLAVAGGYGDSTIHLYETATGEELATLQHPGEVGSLAFNPDGTLLAVAPRGGPVHLWGVKNGNGN